MAFDHYGNGGEMTCDNPKCDNWDSFEGDFMECIEEAKAEGWKIVCKEAGEFKHYCKNCNPYKND